MPWHQRLAVSPCTSRTATAACAARSGASPASMPRHAAMQASRIAAGAQHRSSTSALRRYCGRQREEAGGDSLDSHPEYLCSKQAQRCASATPRPHAQQQSKSACRPYTGVFELHRSREKGPPPHCLPKLGHLNALRQFVIPAASLLCPGLAVADCRLAALSACLHRAAHVLTVTRSSGAAGS